MEEITIKDGKVVVIDQATLRIRTGLELFADQQGFTVADLVDLAARSEQSATKLKTIAELVNDSTLTEKQRLGYIGRLAGAETVLNAE